jgi:hypothetical protein
MWKFIIVTFMAASLISGCRKSKEKSIQASKDYALVQTNISYVAPLIIHTVQSQNYMMDRIRSGQDTLNSCASYNYISGDTVDIASQNLTVEILFSQCMDFDNALKNGSLIIELENYFDADSAMCFVKFDDFSLNDNIISGNLALQRLGGNNFEVITSNLIIFVETRQIKYAGKLKFNMGTGSDALRLYDNNLTIQEEGEITDRFGNFSQTIGTDLIRSLSCNWFGEGLVEIEDVDGDSQILDFGLGTCDNLGYITYANEEIEFAFGL